MTYLSLLEIFQVEDALCREIVTRENIMDAARQVKVEGRDISKHEEMLNTAQKELNKRKQELFMLRNTIGLRIAGMEDDARRAIVGHLMRKEGCRDEGAENHP